MAQRPRDFLQSENCQYRRRGIEREREVADGEQREGETGLESEGERGRNGGERGRKE